MSFPALRPYLWMLGSCAAFTLMNALAHELRHHCDWQVIALFRTGLAFLFAVILTRAARARLVFLGPPSLWIRSLAGSVSLLCAFFAMTRDGPVSNVLVITNIFPIWIALLSWPMLGLRPGWPLMVSICTAVAGVVLIRAQFGDDGAPLWNTGAGAVEASLAALLASVATAVAMLGLNRLAWIDTRAVVAHFSFVAMLCCLGAFFAFDRRIDLAGLAAPAVLFTLLAIGLSATTGQFCLTKAFTAGVPSRVAIVGLTQIVMTLVADVVWFDERFTARHLAGVTMVVAPTAWVILTQARRVKQTTSEQMDRAASLPDATEESLPTNALAHARMASTTSPSTSVKR